MAEIFISYSRKDAPFVERLSDALAAAGRAVWVDVKGIPPTAEFLQEIFAAIEAAENFVFVISPDSVASEVCGLELAHAMQHHKRLVPVLLREVDAKSLPESLAKVNWLRFGKGVDFAARLAALLKTIDTDLDWVRAHTRWLVRAREWEGRERESSFTLRGRDLEAAEKWLARTGTEQPEPTPIHREYIVASRKAATTRKRITLGAVVFALIVAAVLGAIAFIKRRQADDATRAKLGVKAKELAHQPGNEFAALLSAVQAAGPDLARRRTPPPQAFEGLIAAVSAARFSLPLRGVKRDARLAGLPTPVKSAIFSPTGTRAVTWRIDATAQLWDTGNGRLISAFAEHTDRVNDASFSPNGRYVATASDDGTTRVWDARTANPVALLGSRVEDDPDGDENGFFSARFSADSARMLTTGRDDMARVWEVPSGKPLGAIEMSGSAISDWSAHFTPAGTRIVLIDEEGAALLFDLTSAEHTVAARIPSQFFRAAVSPDGRRILAADEANAWRVWDALTGLPLCTLEKTAGSEKPAFSSAGGHVIAGGRDGAVRVWDSGSGTLRASMAVPAEEFRSAVFSRDESRVALLTRKGAHLCDLAQPEPIAVLQGTFTRAAFSSDGAMLTTPADDGTVSVWNARTGESIAVVRGHDRQVWSAEFSPDGAQFLSASEDGDARFWQVKKDISIATFSIPKNAYCGAFSPDSARLLTAANVWDARSREALLSFPADASGRHAAFSPDGTKIVTVGDKGARILDARTGQTIADLGLVASVLFSPPNFFSPDGTRIITPCSDRTAKLWDARTGQLLATLKGHVYDVHSAAFSPDGRQILTTAAVSDSDTDIDEGLTRVWDGQTGQHLATLRGHILSVWTGAFSRDGKRIVTASMDATARIWDAKTFEQLLLLQGTNNLWSAEFSPDGKRVVTASMDGTAEVWDARTGKSLMLLQSHQHSVRSVRFSPDGTRIVTASDDHTAKLWDARTGQLLGTLHGHSAPVWSAAFSPDGGQIVTTSEDGTAKIFAASAAAFFPMACEFLRHQPEFEQVRGLCDEVFKITGRK